MKKYGFVALEVLVGFFNITLMVTSLSLSTFPVFKFVLAFACAFMSFVYFRFAYLNYKELKVSK